MTINVVCPIKVAGWVLFLERAVPSLRTYVFETEHNHSLTNKQLSTLTVYSDNLLSQNVTFRRQHTAPFGRLENDDNWAYNEMSII